MRKFGFGTRVYSSDQYSNFNSILSCYVESGIPLIVAMINDTGSVAHALICIGHEKIRPDHIDSLEPTWEITKRRIFIYDYDSINKDFIFVDDNQPVYQRATLTNPAIHYSHSDWHTCKLRYFIVPLYTKIYLEAVEARNYILNFLVQGPEPLKNDSEIVLRFYLASSRSFKDEVAKKSNLQEELKGWLMETMMPKFIWVAEISTKELIKSKMANGLIIIDATEANIYYNKPLILATYQDKLVAFDESKGSLASNDLPLQPFATFEQNLNAFDI